MSAERNLSVSFLDVATSGSGLLRAPRKEDRCEVATLSVHFASGGVLFDVFPDLGDHD
jgi:hypothetical protein